MASKPKMGDKPVVGKTPALETEDKPRERIEREDIGGDEAYFVNLKRVVEEFLGDSLEDQRRNRLHFDVIMAANQANRDTMHHIMTSRLADKASTAQGREKREGKHDDVAADRMWNIDEVAQLVSKTATQMDAIATSLATVVASLAAKFTAATAASA